MQLNAEQQQAVDLTGWLKEQPGRVGILSGAAGTGKTASTRAILDAHGPSIVIAPTNRAARRSGELTGRLAGTIHAYAYAPVVDSATGNVTFTKKPIHKVERPANGVVIVDESSMVGPAVWDDLWGVVQDIGASVLLVGDAFQLPPVVQGGSTFSVFGPEFVEKVQAGGHECRRVDLVHVFRQALESPVLRAATALREAAADWPAASRIIEGLPACRRVANTAHAMRAESLDHVVITYTNDVRRQINRQVRALSGRDDDADPVAGEPLLVRRTCRPAGLYNGQVVTFPGYADVKFRLPPQWRSVRFGDSTCLINVDVLLDGVQAEPIETRGLPLPYVDVNFGYAVTCHAAQGGEYDHVILQWESSIARMPITERVRWLYTAVSRGRKRVLVGGRP